MVKLIKKNNYYYFQKSYRKFGKIVIKEDYLGKKVPSDFNILKEKFEDYIRKERFDVEIIEIKKNFQNEFENMPKLAKEKYLRYFAVNFTYNSQAIEGSTLSLKDTRFLVEDGIAPNKFIKDIDETREHHKLFLEMLDYKKEISLQLVLFWHKRLFEKTYFEIAGKIRNHDVKVAGSKTTFPNYLEVDYLIEEFFKWYEKNKNKYNGVELAALVHLKFVSIHPFTDGNGRISRLLMNFVLYKKGFPMLDIDYIKRESYYNALEKANLNNTNDYFVDYIMKKFIKENKNYLK